MNSKLLTAVSKTIVDFRKLKNLTQEKLAEKADLDRTYISGIEREKRNLTIASLETIIYALEIPLEDFFDELKKNLKESECC